MCQLRRAAGARNRILFFFFFLQGRTLMPASSSTRVRLPSHLSTCRLHSSEPRWRLTRSARYVTFSGVPIFEGCSTYPEHSVYWLSPGTFSCGALQP